MIRAGEMLTFSFDGKEIRCKIEYADDALGWLTVVEHANTLIVGKEYGLSITRADGVITGAGVVVGTKNSETSETQSGGQGVLEYTVNITRPFRKIQKRGAVRFECYIPASVYEINSTKNNVCHILDISGGGAKILTNNFFVKNTEVNILTILGNKNMHLLGTVLTLDKTDAAKGYEYLMRVKFTEITQQDEEDIFKFIFSEYRKTAHKKNKTRN